VTEAAELLKAARSLLKARLGALHGIWPRAVALLGRQSLERAMDDFWTRLAPDVQNASRTAQLLCLSTYLDDPELVRGIRYAWHAFSRSCHHHIYELAPTAAEIEGMLAVTEEFAHLNASHPTSAGPSKGSTT
jgi:hypothetical protein